MVKAALLIACAFGIDAATEAASQPTLCGETAALMRQAEKIGEVPVWRGLDATGGLVIVLASKAGAWTIVRIDPTHGVACVMSVGEAAGNVTPDYAKLDAAS